MKVQKTTTLEEEREHQKLCQQEWRVKMRRENENLKFCNC
jgi:hypothetical protein